MHSKHDLQRMKIHRKDYNNSICVTTKNKTTTNNQTEIYNEANLMHAWVTR